MACELTPCGSVHFSGNVPGGLQTAPDGAQVYAAGTAIVVQREGKPDTVLQGSDGKVRQREAGVWCCNISPQGWLLTVIPRSRAGHCMPCRGAVRQPPGHGTEICGRLVRRHCHVGLGHWRAAAPLLPAQGALSCGAERAVPALEPAPDAQPVKQAAVQGLAFSACGAFLASFGSRLRCHNSQRSLGAVPLTVQLNAVARLCCAQAAQMITRWCGLFLRRSQPCWQH